MLKNYDDRIKRARSHPPRGSSNGRGRCRLWPLSSVAVMRQIGSDRRESGHRADIVNPSKMTRCGSGVCIAARPCIGSAPLGQTCSDTYTFVFTALSGRVTAPGCSGSVTSGGSVRGVCNGGDLTGVISGHVSSTLCWNATSTWMTKPCRSTVSCGWLRWHDGRPKCLPSRWPTSLPEWPGQ
jgi:hypothetical protein